MTIDRHRVIRIKRFEINLLIYISEIPDKMTFNNHHDLQVLAELSHCKTIIDCIRDLLRGIN